MALQGRSIAVYGIRDEAWKYATGEWTVDRIAAYDPIGPKRLGISPRMLLDLMIGGHDLIHLRGLWSFSSYATATVGKAGVPVLISPEGMLDPWALSRSAKKKRIAFHLFERKNLQRARALHALNKAELAHIRDFGLRNPVAIIPNGVDIPSSLRPNDRAVEPRILLFLGRIHPKKGLEVLAEAWAGALAIAPELKTSWKVHVAGWDEGGHEIELRKKIDRLGLSGDFILRGSLYGSAKDLALRTASAFILPSYGEGLPISALEAAAYGLPLFLTRQCNLPEFIAGGAAFEIDLASDTLARELAGQLTIDYGLLDATGARAREIAAQSFSWDRVIDQYRSLYEWIAFGGASASGLNLF